jgi:hypothetical protein
MRKGDEAAGKVYPLQVLLDIDGKPDQGEFPANILMH